MPNVLTPHANVFIFAQFPSARYRRRSPAYAQLVVHLFFAHCLVTIYLIAAFGHRHPTPTRQAKATSRPFVFDFAFACTAGVLLIFFLSLSHHISNVMAPPQSPPPPRAAFPPPPPTPKRAQVRIQPSLLAKQGGLATAVIFFSFLLLSYFERFPSPYVVWPIFYAAAEAWRGKGRDRTAPPFHFPAPILYERVRISTI